MCTYADAAPHSTVDEEKLRKQGRAERLRRRRRNRVRRRTDLREHRDASPRNARRVGRRRGLLRVARVRTARRNDEALLTRFPLNAWYDILCLRFHD